MRKDAVHTVVLNAPLFKGMQVFLASDPRYMRFTVREGEDKWTTYMFKVRRSCCVSHPVLTMSQVSSSKIAEELTEELNARLKELF